MNQLETFWVDKDQFNYARFHQFIFDRHIDKLADVLEHCRDNPSLSLQQDARTGNFIFTIRAKVVEKFCERIKSTLFPVLDFWIRYDSAWEKLQIDWRPTESISEDYYL